jgi:hypothetical protein
VTPVVPLRVLIASGDPNFRRLAAAMIREAGHVAGTSDLTPDRLARHLRLGTPDVLVLDADPETALLHRDALGERPVVVCAQDEPAPPRAELEIVGKWDAPAELVAAVERAGARRGRPRLRLVS